MATQLLDFYGMFDYLDGDSDIYKYTSEEFATLIAGLCGNGVSKNHLNEFQTTNSGLTLTVASGACFIAGHFAESENAKNITLTATASGATRKDRLVVRLNLSSRTIELATKEGSASALPELTNSETVKEIPLYAITISNGSTVTLADERIFTYSAVGVQEALNAILAALDGKANTSHTHAASALTSAVSVSKGGTGATTAAQARTNLEITPANIGAATANHTHSSVSNATTAANANQLTTARNIKIGNETQPFNGSADVTFSLANMGAASDSHNHTITNLTGTLSVAKGGTGATDAATALANLGIQYATTKPTTVVNGGICLVPIG